MLDRNDEPFADDPEGLKQYQAYLRLKARCKEMAREWREEKERDEQLYQADILLDKIKEGDQ